MTIKIHYDKNSDGSMQELLLKLLIEHYKMETE